MTGIVAWMVVALLLRANGQVQDQLRNKVLCIEQETCGGCMAAAGHCRWCADRYFVSSAPRCDDDASLVENGCSQGMIQRPPKPVWKVLQNASLEDMQLNSHEPVVQIQPQKLRVSLKPRQTQKIKFSYRAARNYPLDLYYLMDLTWSMKDDKETLVSLRDDLPAMLEKLTDNFRIGFGSFADKPLMPYISVDPRHKANPCTTEDEACEPTYSFRHHLSLTNKVSEFIQHVNSSSVTANLDNAEAQLDALTQVVACGSKIGWSAASRKIVIMLSDGLMHTAGDGKLGGAIKRNDEQCHLDGNGYYSEAGIYDYPSVAQVYRLLDKHKVNVIFAVTQDVKYHYDSLHRLLEDFTYVAKLESDSSNILKLVKTGYEDIVSVVDFEDDSHLGPVKVKYFSDCGVKGGPMIETTRCSGVEFGMTLNYEAHISLDSCSELKRSSQTIRISESQLGQDSLSVEVEVQCGCTCDGELQTDTTNCPVNSHLVCGVCQCKKGWSGPGCDCSIENDAAQTALMDQCRAPNVTNAGTCSGAGDCLCGACDCDRGFSGKYCQCKDCKKNIDNGLTCGGEGRGTCVCGNCECEPGWTGETCQCTLSADSCVPPGGGDVCSGRGNCVCGRCECFAAEQGGTSYSGAFCETCPSCSNPLCANAEPCVLCYLSHNCTDVCNIGGANYTVVDYTDRMGVVDNLNNNAISCVFRREEDGSECEYRYTYTSSTKEMIAMEITIRSKECPQALSARIVISGLVTMLCVIAGGIVIIIGVKCAQVFSDRRAYAKFLQEAQESRKNMQELNPLYISPISQFTLPENFPRDSH